MKKISRCFSILFSAILLLSVAGCGSKNTGPVVLVMAEVNPPDSIAAQMDAKFKQEVERISGGDVTIDLQTSGAYGSENEVLEAMINGSDTVQLARISTFSLTPYGATKSALLTLPYTFESREHFWNFVHSDLAKEILDEPAEKKIGVHGLFFGEEGFRSFFATSNISSCSDLKGLKIRVSDDPIMNGLVTGLGATPKFVAFKDLYPAILSGEVDGAEQPLVNYLSNGYNEIAGNIILDEHTLGTMEVVISDKAWKSLSDSQKQAIEEASVIASDFCREISEEAEENALIQIMNSGCNITRVDDKAPWRDACKEVITQNTKDQVDLYQKILLLSKNGS